MCWMSSSPRRLCNIKPMWYFTVESLCSVRLWRGLLNIQILYCTVCWKCTIGYQYTDDANCLNVIVFVCPFLLYIHKRILIWTSWFRLGVFSLVSSGRCSRVYYCSIECQKQAWPQHKFVCVAPEVPYDASEGPIPASEVREQAQWISSVRTHVMMVLFDCSLIGVASLLFSWVAFSKLVNAWYLYFLCFSETHIFYIHMHHIQICRQQRPPQLYHTLGTTLPCRWYTISGRRIALSAWYILYFVVTFFNIFVSLLLVLRFFSHLFEQELIHALPGQW